MLFGKQAKYEGKEMVEKKNSLPYLLLVLAAVFWSGNFVISRAVHAVIPPYALAFWRWQLALLILCTFALPHLRADWPRIQAHWRFICIQGFFGVAGFNTLIYLAMHTTTAINAVLVNSCIPVLIAVCSWIFYQEKMSTRQICGVLLSLTGVLLIIARGNPAHLLAVNFNRGDIYVLLAALCWAVYSANFKRYPANLHPFAYQMAIVVSGLLFLAPLYLNEVRQGYSFSINPATIATLVYVAVFASILAFIFWNRAVRMVGANKAGPFIHLMPVFSTLLAVLFLDERLYGYHGFGSMLIFAGIGLATLNSTASKVHVDSSRKNRS